MIERTLLVAPTVDELAAEFSSLSSDEQARFFWRVAQIWKGWGYERDHQILDVNRNLRLLYPEALQFVEDLGRGTV